MSDIKLVAWVKGDNEYHERDEVTVSELVAALQEEGGEVLREATIRDKRGNYRNGDFLVVRIEGDKRWRRLKPWSLPASTLAR